MRYVTGMLVLLKARDELRKVKSPREIAEVLLKYERMVSTRVVSKRAVYV